MAEATMESPSTILPDELMIEILFRVESSNPFQLRCVCKLWNSLILDPQFMKKHVGRSLTEIKDLHNKAKEHYIAFKSQIVGNNPIMPQEQVDGDDHEDEEAAEEEEGDEAEEGNEQVDGDDHEDDDDDEDEDEEAAAAEGDEAEEGNEQVDGDDHEDEDDYDDDDDDDDDDDEDENEEAAEGDEAEEGNDNEEGKEEDAEEEDKEKKLLMNIVAPLDAVLGNVVGQLNILDTIKVSQLDDMLVKTIRANLLAQLDRVKCLKSFLEVYLESPTSSFSSSQL
jgi:hypothetical protein